MAHSRPDSLELGPFRREIMIAGASEKAPSSSAADDSGEDGGDDSVIEVVPTPKKIIEVVDLTSSPVPSAGATARTSPVPTGCTICLESIRDIRCGGHSRGQLLHWDGIQWPRKWIYARRFCAACSRSVTI